MSPSNRTLAIELIERGFKAADHAVIERLIASDYIQHSPYVGAGRDGVLALLDAIARLPDNVFRVHRIVEDGAFVMLHSEWVSAGAARAVFDIFRVVESRFVEHWDAIQDVPASGWTDGATSWNGPSEVRDRELTHTNKSIVDEFVSSVLIEHREQSAALLSDQLIRHAASAPHGGRAFLQHAGIGPTEGSVRYLRLHRLIGEGDFVCAQCEGRADGRPSVLCDLYRVDAGRIVEQWGVSQPIEPSSRHGNRMI